MLERPFDADRTKFPLQPDTRLTYELLARSVVDILNKTQAANTRFSKSKRITDQPNLNRLFQKMSLRFSTRFTGPTVYAAPHEKRFQVRTRFKRLFTESLLNQN